VISACGTVGKRLIRRPVSLFVAGGRQAVAILHPTSAAAQFSCGAVWEADSMTRLCLVAQKFYKMTNIFRHIESCCTCMEH